MKITEVKWMTVALYVLLLEVWFESASHRTVLTRTEVLVQVTVGAFVVGY